MPVEIVEYDPAWPAAFAAEQQRLSPLLDGAPIHHMGSTAVVDLAAKPIIDMIVLVESYEPAISRLITEAGYQYPAAYNATLSTKRWLCFPSAAIRTHHISLVTDPAELSRHLRFRDALRTDAALAREYEALKRSLAERYRHDRDAYTQAKREFVQRHERAR